MCEKFLIFCNRYLFELKNLYPPSIFSYMKTVENTYLKFLGTGVKKFYGYLLSGYPLFFTDFIPLSKSLTILIIYKP